MVIPPSETPQKGQTYQPIISSINKTTDFLLFWSQIQDLGYSISPGEKGQLIIFNLFDLT